MIVSNFLALVDNCSQGDTEKCLSVLPESPADRAQLQGALSIVFGILGALAVITLVLAAINMATATGDVDKISRAKKSIIYSLIGLIIAVSAEIIVFTVVGRL